MTFKCKCSLSFLYVRLVSDAPLTRPKDYRNYENQTKFNFPGYTLKVKQNLIFLDILYALEIMLIIV